MEDFFADIVLGVEEPVAEGPPLKKKKKKASETRMVCKYPRSRKFFECLQSSHMLRRCISF